MILSAFLEEEIANLIVIFQDSRKKKKYFLE